MPAGFREIKSRIKSVKNTKKITKAMELVSASKMRRAVAAVSATRPYAQLGWQMLLELVSRTDASLHPLLKKREGKKVAIIVISSNRGLCGGFNTNLIEKIKSSLEKHLENVEQTDFITYGKVGRETLIREKFNVVADFEKPDAIQGITEVTPINELIMQDYKDGKYDKVFVAYTDYKSALIQKPRIKQILPVDYEAEELFGEFSKEELEVNAFFDTSKNYEFEFLFEPSPEAVLKSLIPRLVEIQVYQSVLESDASEHSARMMTMKNATESASDMIDSLTLQFNRTRQQAITQEIAEISAGRLALGA